MALLDGLAPLQFKQRTPISKAPKSHHVLYKILRYCTALPTATGDMFLITVKPAHSGPQTDVIIFMIQALWNSTWQLCKVTRIRTDVRRTVVIFLARVKHHFFFKRPTPPKVPPKPTIQRVLGACSLAVKRSARERDNSSHPVPRLRIYGFIPPLPHAT